MPPKPHPSDWDRFFGPRPHHRRGPLQLLRTGIFGGITIAVLMLFGQFGSGQATRIQARNMATATAAWSTFYATKTAEAAAASAAAQVTATPTVVTPSMPVGTVLNGSNLRSEPRIAPGTIAGQLTVGDQVQVLEASPPANPAWYRIRINKTDGTLRVGTEGWLSATLLSVTAPPSDHSAGPAAARSPTGAPK